MGWARANIVFDRLPRLPDAGSPMEILMLVLWRMRQNIEFQKERAVLTALLNQQGAEPKNIEQAFKDLRAAFFPFEKTKREEEISTLKKAMEAELARGALSVKPMMDLTKDTMRKKLAKGEQALQDRANKLRRGTLKSLDRDPFLTARTRKRHTVSSTAGGHVMRPVRPIMPKPELPV